ncbi:MAG: hypothetical protein ACR2JQ_02870 [Mycobacteriales bacterium]
MTCRSGLLAAWSTAWLAGTTSYDEAVTAVTGQDAPHQVVGLRGGRGRADATAEPVPLGWLLTEIRASHAGPPRLALPVPGDPRGLPPGIPFTAAAMEAGEAALTDDLGVVPAVTGGHGDVVTWRAFQIPAAPPDLLSPGEAGHDLDETLRTVTTALTALDVTSWRADIGAAIAAVRRQPPVPLPPGHDQQARALLARAESLADLLRLADDDPGGAVTSREARQRAQLLAPLRAAVRRARLAAYNATTTRAS